MELTVQKKPANCFISISAAVAEMERENIRVQTMAGREQKAREGKWNGDLLLMDISWKMVNFPVYEGKFIKQL